MKFPITDMIPFKGDVTLGRLIGRNKFPLTVGSSRRQQPRVCTKTSVRDSCTPTEQPPAMLAVRAGPNFRTLKLHARPPLNKVRARRVV